MLPPTRAREDASEPLVLTMPVLRAFLWIAAGLVALLSVLPSLYALLWAAAGSETVGVLQDGPSLRWFVHILADPQWRESIAYSTIVATVSSVLGAIVLLVHFYFMRYMPVWADRSSYACILIVLLVPAVLYALGLRILGGSLGLSEKTLLFVGHFVLVLPLQFLVIESAQENVPSDLLFAGSTLGASHFRNIVFVYAPLMIEAFWGAFLVGFFFSFDELVIAAFVLDSPVVTVPRRLWDQIHRSMDPSPAVISSLVAAAFLVALGATFAARAIRAIQDHTS